MERTKHIKSEFDRKVIDVLKHLVPDQRMRLVETTRGFETTWTAFCKDKEGLSVVEIFRSKGANDCLNMELVAKVIYDYDTGKETVSYL